MRVGSVRKKNISVWIICGRIGLVCYLVLAASVAAASAADYTKEGTEKCLSCHAGDAMTVMADTVHGDIDNPHAPYATQGCESCHGPGSLHNSRARGGAGSPPLLRFGAQGDPQSEQTATCLACHAEAMGDLEGMAWTGSLHDTDEISCSNCHTMHVAVNPLAERAQQEANCAACHEDQIDSHNRFERKGIVFEKLTCHDCHDVHQLQRDH